MVGTKIGQVHTETQGTGLATVLNVNPMLQVMAQTAKMKGDAAALRGKQRAQNAKDGAKRMVDENREVEWERYSNDVVDGYSVLNTQAVELMNQGIPNVWTSNDPRARQLRDAYSTMQKGTTRINALHEQVLKEKEAIVIRGDKYTSQSISSVESFGEGISTMDMVNGYKVDAKGNKTLIEVPRLQYRNPSTLFADLYSKGAKDLSAFKDENGFIDQNRISDYTMAYFTAPENEANLEGARQMYERLDPDSDMAKRARSKSREMGVPDSPEVGLQIQQLENMLSPDTLNMSDVVGTLAGEAPLDEFGRSEEDMGGVTEASSGSRLSDKNYPMNTAGSYLMANRWVLERPDVLTQLGVDSSTAGNLDELFETTQKALAGRIEDSIETSYESSLSRQGSGAGAKEITANADDWLKRIYNPENTQVKQEAISWLSKTQIEGLGYVEQAYAVPALKGAPLLDDDQNGAVTLVFSDPETAQAAQQKLFDNELKYGNLKSKVKADVSEDEYNKLLEGYKNMSRGNKMVIPLTANTAQLWKNVHNTKVRKDKTLFETTLGMGLTPGRIEDRMKLDK